MQISRTIEFDAGHRVMRHGAGCANPHGHRYAVTLAVTGIADHPEDDPRHGMVTDFGDLKAWLTEHVHDRFDHGFICEAADNTLIAALETVTRPDHEPVKLIIVDYTPTAENLASDIGAAAVAWTGDNHLPFSVHHVTVRETPNSYAVWHNPLNPTI